MKLTTESNYDADLEQAKEMIEQRVDFSEADGEMEKWAMDKLNNTWVEGISVDEWVDAAAKALGR